VTANGFEIIGDVREIIESAHKGKRQRFMKVLTEIQQLNEPVALFLYDISRFSRDSSGMVMVETDRLRREGKVELHFVYDNVVIHKESRVNEEDRWRTEVQRHWYDSARKSERVKEVIDYKLQKGEFPSVAPVGYLNVIEGFKSGSIHKKIIIDPERGKLVQEAFGMYVEDTYSLEELARILKNKGFTVKGKRTKTNPEAENRHISKAGLLSMLRNPFYSGKFWFTNPTTNKRELWNASNYEPIISEELFEKVQKILSRKAVKYSTKKFSPTKFFKFRGLLKCAFCGSLLTPNDMKENFKGKRSGSGIYYRCTYGKKNSNPDWYKEKFGLNHSGVGKYKGETIVNCPERMLSEDRIEEEIKNQLKLLHYDKKVFKELSSALKREHESRMSVVAVEKKNLQIEIEQKQKLMKGLIRMQAQDPDFETISEFKEELLKARDEVDNLKEQLEALEESVELDVDEFLNTMQMCSDLASQYDGLPDHKKRELVMIAFSSITVRKGRVGKLATDAIDFNWNEPFNTLLEKGLDKILKSGGGDTPTFPSGMNKGKSIIKNSSREPDEVGRRGLYEHGKNKEVWRFKVEAKDAE
ncbi:MAG: recombinase family protein, partial [Candidatus Aminicenantaceae bacterium]